MTDVGYHDVAVAAVAAVAELAVAVDSVALTPAPALVVEHSAAVLRAVEQSSFASILPVALCRDVLFPHLQ